jgi:hypothetical protein
MMWKTVNWLIPTSRAKWHNAHHLTTSSNDFISCNWSSYMLIILQCPNPDGILSPTMQQFCMAMPHHHILPADINIPLQYDHECAQSSSRNSVPTLWTCHRSVLYDMMASFACWSALSCLTGMQGLCMTHTHARAHTHTHTHTQSLSLSLCIS